MKVRQSTLGDADKCLRAMQYSIEHPVYHGGSVRAAGTAYHKGLERLYDPTDILHESVADKPDLVLEIIIPAAIQCFLDTVEMKPSHISEHSKTAGTFKWDEAIPDVETGTELLTFALRTYVEGGHVWPHNDWNVLAVEPEFHLPFTGEHTRDGSPDLILESRDDGGVVVVDHKTANKAWPYNKHHARKSNQAPWLVAAVRELWEGRPSYRFVFDIMTWKGKFERRVSAVTEEHIRAVESKALSVVAIYESLRAAGMDLPANPASTLCSPKYCDHWDICPYGEALDTQ